MSLRKRLIYLLAAFAAFAVVAAFATIWGVQLHVEDAITSFQRSMAQAGEVEHLRLGARVQLAKLRDVVDGRREASASYLADRDAFFIALKEFVRFAHNHPSPLVWSDILDLVDTLDKEFQHCVALVQSSRVEEARGLLNKRIEQDLLAALEARLTSARSVLATSRHRAVNELVATNTEVLILAAVVGVFGAGLVVVGTTLIRRWLMVPITKLQVVLEEFGRGNLEQRVEVSADDELGALGKTLNRMAGSLGQAQADLHISEAKYRSLFENLRDVVVICDANGRVVESHDSDTHLLGLQNATRVGRHLLDIWPGWRSGMIDWESLIDHVMTSGSQYRAAAVTLERSKTDGEEVVVDLVAYPVEYGEGRYAALVLRDVTERHHLEEQVRRTEAMEATVTFARGIAHDFMNLLTSATGTLSLLEPHIKDAKQLARIQTASRACWQAAGLASRLMNFADCSEGHPQVFSLNEMVEVTLSSLDETLMQGIRVRFEGDESVLVKADRDQLTQVILNLIRNACEAMPDGGELRIKARYAPADPAVRKQTAPRYALLTVADTGCGMPPEVKQRIFEPFYTTKARTSRRGRGMGLAVVYAAVKSAGGNVRVESHPGAGTRFEIYVPAGQGVPVPVDPLPCTDPVEEGTGTILLVENDNAMLRSCTEAFEKWGYSVVAADCVSDAQAKFASLADHKVDLAMININLPDGDGARLARELVADHPGLRLIFTTGFADMEVPRELEPKVCARLFKPFQFGTLARTVAAALAAP